MKKLSTTLVLSVMLTGAAFAQLQRGHAKAAVVEFSPGANVSGMTAEAKRHFQASMAARLARSAKFDIADTQHTREASQANLADVNNEASTAAAVKVGKRLGVSYVLTGNVAEYNPEGGGGSGSVTLRVRLVEVASGRVAYSGEIAQKGTRKMFGTGVDEMHSNVLMPAIAKVVQEIAPKP